MLQASSIAIVLVLGACARPQPVVYMPNEAVPREATSTTAAEPMGVSPAESTTSVPVNDTSLREFAIPTLAMGLVVHSGMLVWADLTGALWTMPVDGSTAPKQMSEQHRDGLATHPFIAGDVVCAKAGKDLLELTLPDGPIKRAVIKGTPALVEEVVGDATTIFLTVFQHDQIFKAPINGGAAQHVADIKGGVLALHGNTLYVVSYAIGELFSIPLAGGAPHTIAVKLNHATALVVDDHAAYVYTEGDRRVSAIELATGATTILGEHLDNSDELQLAGNSLYTVSWPDKLVALPTVAGRAPKTLADHLSQPRGVAVDDRWVYVTSDKPARIVRVPRL